jgi:hypothetical protein
MLEKYEKPELFSQKMELNVLRATCDNKTTNSTDPAQPPEVGCENLDATCMGCTITNPEMS